MSENTVKTSRKRGQRRNNIDVPQRLLDRLTPSVLETETPDFVTKEAGKAVRDVLTLDKLFNIN